MTYVACVTYVTWVTYVKCLTCCSGSRGERGPQTGCRAAITRRGVVITGGVTVGTQRLVLISQRVAPGNRAADSHRTGENACSAGPVRTCGNHAEDVRPRTLKPG